MLEDLTPISPPTLSVPYTSALLTQFFTVPLNSPAKEPIELMLRSYPMVTPDSTVQFEKLISFCDDVCPYLLVCSGWSMPPMNPERSVFVPAFSVTFSKEASVIVTPLYSPSEP